MFIYYFAGLLTFIEFCFNVKTTFKLSASDSCFSHQAADRPAAGYLAFSFLCTFVPGSEKCIERTFAPVEHSLDGTFASQERMFQELSLHGTFAHMEPSLHKQLSFINTGVNVRIKIQPTNINCCSVLPYPTHCCE